MSDSNRVNTPRDLYGIDTFSIPRSIHLATEHTTNEDTDE